MHTNSSIDRLLTATDIRIESQSELIPHNGGRNRDHGSNKSESRSDFDRSSFLYSSFLLLLRESTSIDSIFILGMRTCSPPAHNICSSSSSSTRGREDGREASGAAGVHSKSRCDALKHNHHLYSTMREYIANRENF